LHTTKEPFALTDLEAKAAERGAIRQSVKEVITQLVANDEAKSDKIGVTAFYWSFPSEAANKRQRLIDQTTETIEHSKEKINELQKEEQELRKKRKLTTKREEKLEKLTALTEEKAQMEIELKKYKDSDPAIIEALEEDIATATEAANRWTDNIWTLKSWAVK